MVIEYDADLGLSVITQRPRGLRESGGRGVGVKDVIFFLESISPGPSQFTLLAIASLGYATTSTLNNIQMLIDCILPRIHSQDEDLHIPVPLINGRSLSIAYLEWLVMNCEQPPAVQDEYVLLLIHGIPTQLDVDHKANDMYV
jgi:hypothetical protein